MSVVDLTSTLEGLGSTWSKFHKPIQFALLLKFLHVSDMRHLPYLLGNIDAGHV